MSLSDRDNPFARPSAWPTETDPPAEAPEPPRAVPRPARNTIFSGSAVPMAARPLTLLPPAARPLAAQQSEPPPHPEERPAGEPPPPLRQAAFVAPPEGARRRRRRNRLARHAPLIGALVSAATGFAVMAVVFTRPPAAPDIPPPHRPAHLATLRASAAVVPAAERPTLRGAVQSAIARARGALPQPPSEPAAIAPVPSAPAIATAAPPAPKPAPPRFTPPPAPDPEAPIATRAPYG